MVSKAKAKELEEKTGDGVAKGIQNVKKTESIGIDMVEILGRV